MSEAEAEPPVFSNVQAVLDFLRQNGLKEAESALKEDMNEKNELGLFDFEKFLFVLPPVRIPASLRRTEADGGGEASRSSSGSGSDEEFVSLKSSTSDLCSSEFTNPYGLRSASQANSETSSDRLSQFGTARDYPGLDLQNDLYWYDERDEGYFMSPSFNGQDYFGGPSEDKFVMTSETVNQSENPVSLYNKSEGFGTEATNDFLDKPCLFNLTSVKDENEAQAMDYYHFDKRNHLEGDFESNGCSVPLCKCYAGAGENCCRDHIDQIYLSSKETDLSDFQLKIGDIPTDCDIAPGHGKNKNGYYSSKAHSKRDWFESYKSSTEIISNGFDDYEVGNGREANGEADELKAEADEEGEVNTDELLLFNNQEDECEVFNLRIIHRKNRTGFEENKDLPIVLNTVIAGRYYVTEYLGSAAFSKVVQAHDLHTGVDVCLKIIKNDKDFFDQSLDEIKLLKLVNKHDPADEHHILRLYDYFYHQEHLVIVCELLRANLYEFQKFNQESGGEPYFTLSRLQVITRQCLEALEYLHHLGIIHCDLKPENILIKSYRRCEIKVIDLGSSCFQSDNLCLYVQSRSYRAPEVILGLPYDQKIDLWSLGCILVELCSGEVLFPNDSVVMILARMIGMLGPIDLEMLVRGQETHKYFTKEYDLYYTNEETNQAEYIIPEESSLEHHLQTYDAGFIDFVRSLLEVNPLRRPTAREALEHPWLSYSYESNSY
ncbi:hypothetical protein P3X46_014400 [Hevea brasiliensis]|uniref:Protein kinase domain-containing protein n=1 Tax=Hevea brasiliensis TaxID=3981 RepID=A0ABQ9M6J3_HEVBR|nr:uncharacterized protein LOC110646449 [Hevea brasiliensis]KAJ9175894.1 hypothetical protein P3X46_014400 [Hevea brasiliensis]